jgi:hypothetical protein
MLHHPPDRSARSQPTIRRETEDLRQIQNHPALPAHKLALRLNIYNALNANPALEVRTQAGEEFLRPRDIMPPRLAEVSASYSF